jgi:hypothetical protein
VHIGKSVSMTTCVPTGMKSMSLNIAMYSISLLKVSACGASNSQ